MWFYRYTKSTAIEQLPIYLVSIGLHELQPPVTRPQGYEYAQFFFHDVGEGTLVVGDRRYHIPQGGVMYIPAGTPHEYYPHGDRWNLRWVTVGGSALEQTLLQLGLTSELVFPGDDISGLDVLLNHMNNTIIHNGTRGEFMASGSVYEFIMAFASLAGLIAGGEEESENKTEDTYTRHMEQISDYVEYHYMHHISMEELCRLLSVTPQHICRVVKQCTGMRPMEYIQHRRIEGAKRLLRMTDHSISAVAAWSGMESSSYFCRVFKRMEGMTPSEYRTRVETRDTAP